MANQNWLQRTLARMSAGRMRKVPERETTAYARLMNIGSMQYRKDRPLIKPTPANLRMFSRTVYARRAINRIKDTIVALDWEIGPKADVKANGEIKRQCEIVKTCFDSPNHDDSFRTLLEQVIEDICVGGAGAIEQEVGADQLRPLWLWPVDALSIQIYAGWDGTASQPRYVQAHGYSNIGGVQGTPLLNSELIYIRKDPSTENPFGYGPVEIAFRAISSKLGVAEYANNLASNAQPENLLQFVGMDKTQLDAMRVWWRNEIEGQGMTPLIGGAEVKAHKLRGAEDKALYLEYQNFLIREIMTAFGLSPMNGGIEGDVNRNTAEVADDRDWAAAIVPMAQNIESYLNREAIGGRLGFSQIEFRFKGLKRDDELNLATVYEKEYKNNAITPNEYRARRDMPPMKTAWADLNAADVEIAIKAAQGAKAVNPKIIDEE